MTATTTNESVVILEKPLKAIDAVIKQYFDPYFFETLGENDLYKLTNQDAYEPAPVRHIKHAYNGLKLIQTISTHFNKLNKTLSPLALSALLKDLASFLIQLSDCLYHLQQIDVKEFDFGMLNLVQEAIKTLPSFDINNEHYQFILNSTEVLQTHAFSLIKKSVDSFNEFYEGKFNGLDKIKSEAGKTYESFLKIKEEYANLPKIIKKSTENKTTNITISDEDSASLDSDINAYIDFFKEIKLSFEGDNSSIFILLAKLKMAYDKFQKLPTLKIKKETLFLYNKSMEGMASIIAKIDKQLLSVGLNLHKYEAELGLKPGFLTDQLDVLLEEYNSFRSVFKEEPFTFNPAFSRLNALHLKATSTDIDDVDQTQLVLSTIEAFLQRNINQLIVNIDMHDLSMIQELVFALPEKAGIRSPLIDYIDNIINEIDEIKKQSVSKNYTFNFSSIVALGADLAYHFVGSFLATESYKNSVDKLTDYVEIKLKETNKEIVFLESKKEYFLAKDSVETDLINDVSDDFLLEKSMPVYKPDFFKDVSLKVKEAREIMKTVITKNFDMNYFNNIADSNNNKVSIFDDDLPIVKQVKLINNLLITIEKYLSLYEKNSTLFTPSHVYQTYKLYQEIDGYLKSLDKDTIEILFPNLYTLASSLLTPTNEALISAEVKTSENNFNFVSLDQVKYIKELIDNKKHDELNIYYSGLVRSAKDGVNYVFSKDESSPISVLRNKVAEMYNNPVNQQFKPQIKFFDGLLRNIHDLYSENNANNSIPKKMKLKAALELLDDYYAMNGIKAFKELVKFLSKHFYDELKAVFESNLVNSLFPIMAMTLDDIEDDLCLKVGLLSDNLAPLFNLNDDICQILNVEQLYEAPYKELRSSSYKNKKTILNLKKEELTNALVKVELENANIPSAERKQKIGKLKEKINNIEQKIHFNDERNEVRMAALDNLKNEKFEIKKETVFTESKALIIKQLEKLKANFSNPTLFSSKKRRLEKLDLIETLIALLEPTNNIQCLNENFHAWKTTQVRSDKSAIDILAKHRSFFHIASASTKETNSVRVINDINHSLKVLLPTELKKIEDDRTAAISPMMGA